MTEPMLNEPILQVRDLRKSYDEGRIEALRASISPSQRDFVSISDQRSGNPPCCNCWRLDTPPLARYFSKRKSARRLIWTPIVREASASSSRRFICCHVALSKMFKFDAA